MKGRSIFNIAVSLVIFGSSSSPVLAELKQAIEVKSDRIAQQQSNCPGSNNIEIQRCLRLNYEAADRRLNEVYKQLTSKLSREERSILSEAQQEWIKLRDKNCEFEVYQNRGGTGYRGFLNECLERMTKQRTGELEKYLKPR
ncbi:lysozyme inhibitor LprI family protein [Microcoleus sp. Pol12B5]|uniref:lysozyme inhibitor LprI family protein n=1 Tax=Microcoleus sp. Pol12B5 TaxID=3055396 RepID=UPI002FD0C97F